MEVKYSKDWKQRILKGMRIESVELSLEDWIILFLASDGFKGIDGKLKIHFMLFLYSPFISVKFRPTFLGVYSEEVELAIRDLILSGYVRKIHRYDDGIKQEYVLTERGRSRAIYLMNSIANKWVLSADKLVVKQGKNILSEIESIKKTYNNKSNLTILALLIDKIVEEKHTYLVMDSLEKEILREIINELKKYK
ncbi:MAG: hypothetical protein DRJ44_02815 [Thermoprotei archaeon]|nr:MAG: hypothetical protein DRJ44_02815 [Thermoprotei archaeon]